MATRLIVEDSPVERRGSQAWRQRQGAVVVAEGLVVPAPGRVSQGAVVIAFGGRRCQRDGDAEGMDGIAETVPPVGADTAIKVGPKIVRANLGGVRQLFCCLLKVPGAEQRPCQGQVFPGTAVRWTRRGWVLWAD